MTDHTCSTCGKPGPYIIDGGLCHTHYEQRLKREGRRTWRRADLVAEARHLLHDDTPERIAARLGVTCGAVARAACREGARDVAAQFDAARRRAAATHGRNAA